MKNSYFEDGYNSISISADLNFRKKTGAQNAFKKIIKLFYYLKKQKKKTDSIFHLNLQKI